MIDATRFYLLGMVKPYRTAPHLTYFSTKPLLLIAIAGWIVEATNDSTVRLGSIYLLQQ